MPDMQLLTLHEYIRLLEKAIRELHQLADSGESDLRAIGPILDRFPELRPSDNSVI